MTTLLRRIYFTTAGTLYHERTDCFRLNSAAADPVRAATGAEAIRAMAERRPCPRCTS